MCFPRQAAADGPSLLSAFASPAENSRVPGRHLSFARTIHFTSLGCKGLLAFNLQLNQPELSLAHAIRVFLPSQNLWELTQEVPSRHSRLRWRSLDLLCRLVNGQILIQQGGRGTRGRGWHLESKNVTRVARVIVSQCCSDCGPRGHIRVAHWRGCLKARRLGAEGIEIPAHLEPTRGMEWARAHP